jgi:hypothetical protein
MSDFLSSSQSGVWVAAVDFIRELLDGPRRNHRGECRRWPRDTFFSRFLTPQLMQGADACVYASTVCTMGRPHIPHQKPK